jgi:hypothetical protein
MLVALLLSLFAALEVHGAHIETSCMIGTTDFFCSDDSEFGEGIRAIDSVNETITA